MTRTVINQVILAIVLVLVQVVCNKMMLLGVAMPIVFIYVLLRLPASLGTSWVLTIGFFLGLVVDIFNDTPGMNAMAATMLATARRPVFYMFAPHDVQEDGLLPGLDSMGVAGYLRYATVLTILFATVLFLIQAFTLRDGLLTLERIVASSALSVLLMLGMDSLSTGTTTDA